MPIISSFYGIIIRMYFRDNQQHKFPHIHTKYNEENAVFDLEGNLIEGSMPIKQKKIIIAWIEIHKKELKKLWSIVVEGSGYFTIEPLR